MLVEKKVRHVRGVAILVDRDAGAQAGSVAKRISALARRDFFRPMGRETDGEEHLRIPLGDAVGDCSIPAVDGADGTRSEEAGVSPQFAGNSLLSHRSLLVKV
jgi:hypothetical protein